MNSDIGQIVISNTIWKIGVEHQSIHARWFESEGLSKLLHDEESGFILDFIFIIHLTTVRQRLLCYVIFLASSLSGYYDKILVTHQVSHTKKVTNIGLITYLGCATCCLLLVLSYYIIFYLDPAKWPGRAIWDPSTPNDRLNRPRHLLAIDKPIRLLLNF